MRRHPPQPAERAANARDTRKAFADIEFEVSAFTIQEDNSQRATEAMFHKTLPHDDLGQVREPGVGLGSSFGLGVGVGLSTSRGS